MKNTFTKYQIILLLLWLAIGVFGRLVPHLPNMTPFTSLSVLAGAVFARRISFLLILVTLVLSDLFLAFLYHYPVFGTWTLFTYSGFALIVLASSYQLKQIKFLDTLLFAGVSSLGFWVWTNFGVWLTSHIYPLNFNGLVMCYGAAIPFLRNALLGSLLWMVVLLTAWQVCSRKERSRKGAKLAKE